MAPRILLCGDVLGRFNALFKRIATVSKANGPFDALLCVGQFFPNHVEELDEMKQYIQGQKEIPLPTYFTGDFGEGVASVLSAGKLNFANQGFKMEGIPVCSNLYWLKGSGKFILHGLSVAYLSGRSSSSGSAIGVYCEDDIDALRAFAEESGIVDLFLTNEWPQGILSGANLADAPPGIEHLSGGNAVIAELVRELKPRYHIAGCEGIFYAREPYTNDGASHGTRFLGLAAVGNDKKQKFIHALSPTPASVMSASELSAMPANATASPYNILRQSGGAKDTKKRPEPSDSQYWRYDISQKRHKGGATDGEKLCFQFLSSGSCSRGEKCNFRHDTDNKSPFSKGVCFDFISKGRCERGSDCKFRHSSVDGGGSDDQIRPGSCFDFFRKGRCDKGDDCRFSHDLDAGKKRGNAVSTTNQSCWFCLSSPNIDSHLVVSIGENFYCAIAKGPLVEGHVLIIPIEHLPSTLSLPPDADGEIRKYKHALKIFFRKEGNSIIVFERYFNLRGATHAHLQVVPIPLSKASAVRSEFVSAGKKLGFEFDVIRPGENDVDAKLSLKKLLHTGNGYFFVELPEGTILAHSLESGEKLPVQFGREVLASLLGKTDRSDWKDCKLSKEEETSMADDFKTRFESFDPMNSS